MSVVIFIAFLFLLNLLRIPSWLEKRPILVLCTLLMTVVGISYFFKLEYIGYLFSCIVVMLYVLFYAKNYDGISQFLYFESILFIVLSIAYWILPLKYRTLFPLVYAGILYAYILAKSKRLKSYLWIIYLIVFISCLYFYKALLISSLIFLGFIILLESQYSNLNVRFIKNQEDFQKEVISHHYEEVKSVYLNMRGWRHDYHNHIQSMKAYLELNQIDALKDYLHELDEDLKKVDMLVKSGNLMMDAILNSKLSLAKEKNIQVICKANVPEDLPVSDIDICVIMGNLMDNAIEACAKIDEDKRFIRVYIDIVRSQFYVSIMNSAKDDLSFNEKNYITEKRGNHGHGMKRVKLTVDKYDGYLNLKNESGVFVSEVMIPVEIAVSCTEN